MSTLPALLAYETGYRDGIAEARDAIQRVRDLHWLRTSGGCHECAETEWPCPTLRAIEGDQP